MKLVDLSTNGTFINDEKIGKNNEKELKNGDVVHLLHISKVKVEGFLLSLNNKLKRNYWICNIFFGSK